MAKSFKLGVDVGGTFTDVNLLDQTSGEIFNHKVPSTPQNPSQAVITGIVELLDRIGAEPAAVGDFVHGTTIALNSIIQRTGAKVALIVSPGNRDVLEIARLGKPNIFDLHSTLPDSLVSRGLVFEVDGQVTPQGEIVEETSSGIIENGLAELAKAEVESVAVCLLHAYANPANERSVKKQLSLSNSDLPVSLSSGLWPEIREYERASVSVLNAYVQPLMSRYLDSQREESDQIGMAAKNFLTRSNGGVMAADIAPAVSGIPNDAVGADDQVVRTNTDFQLVSVEFTRPGIETRQVVGLLADEPDGSIWCHIRVARTPRPPGDLPFLYYNGITLVHGERIRGQAEEYQQSEKYSHGSKPAPKSSRVPAGAYIDRSVVDSRRVAKENRRLAHFRFAPLRTLPKISSIGFREPVSKILGIKNRLVFTLHFEKIADFDPPASFVSLRDFEQSDPVTQPNAVADEDRP